jgi:hypothetical protein
MKTLTVKAEKEGKITDAKVSRLDSYLIEELKLDTIGISIKNGMLDTYGNRTKIIYLAIPSDLPFRSYSSTQVYT